MRSLSGTRCDNPNVKSLLSISAALALLAAACSTIAAESDVIFTPFPGLECYTDQYWGEYGSFRYDAEGLATPSAAVEAGMARWLDQVDGEVALSVTLRRPRAW